MIKPSGYWIENNKPVIITELGKIEIPDRDNLRMGYVLCKTMSKEDLESMYTTIGLLLEEK